ncbi:c-type cytochrome [Calidithermus timidus]|uniref:c-type cytochrome n=1 Tax=Calidithermus timidus TaxID=307124 RepID=UPI001FE00090|nr:c-type cytochrome [Calidithermus timidus]
MLGVVCMGFLPGAVAYDPEEPDVLVAQSPVYGQYLTDLKGRSLYLFTRDSKDTVTCYDACAQNWPPLLLEKNNKPLGDKGVDAKLLGTAKRNDRSSLQITYNGWPLYYFARDQKPGDTNGQGVGGVWFLVSPKGEAIKTTATQQPGGAATQTDALLAQLKAEGQAIYARICVACHGAEGQGGVGVRLAGNSQLRNARYIAGLIIGGGQQMPAFGRLLSDREIAAVATYVRNSWGNQFGLITEEEVKATR